MARIKAILVIMLMSTCAVQAYTVDAGNPSGVQLYDASTAGVQLNAAIIDPNGEIFYYAWTSDPCDGVVFFDDYDQNPIVKFATTGSYLLTVVVTNDMGSGSASDFTIRAVIEPTIDAGVNQEVWLYDASTAGVALNSTLSFPYPAEGYDYLWSSDPAGGVVFTDPCTADPTVTFTTGGEYVLTLNVTGDSVTGALAPDTVTITVIAPTVHAGPNQEVGLPEAEAGVFLDSWLTDTYPDPNETFTYVWSSIPVWDSIADSANDADPNVTFIATGIYVLTLNVTGSLTGALVADTVTITVGPLIDAGDNQVVELPVASTTGVALNSTISNANVGEIFTYTWTSDPCFATCVPNGTTTAADPTVTFTTVGTYVLTLNVTSNQGSIIVPDTVTINVSTSWTGAVDTDWHTAGNWLTGVVPDPNIGAYLGMDTTSGINTMNTVNIDAAVDVVSINIAADPCYPYTVNVNSGYSVTTERDIKIGDDGDGELSALAGSVITIGDDLEVGDEGIGIFTMTGGTLTVSDDIEVSKDVGGTGDMYLDGVVVTCDDLRVASDSADSDGSGVGTLTFDNCDVTIDDDLTVGNNGDGTFTMIGGTLIVGDNIKVCIDANGIGDMYLEGVTVTCDDLYIASDNDDDNNFNGEGTVTLINSNIVIDDGELRIGNRGTGTLTATGGLIEVAEDVEVGKRGTGTLTLNSTNILSEGGKFVVGHRDGGYGEVIMTGTSRIEAGDNVCIGGDDSKDGGEDNQNIRTGEGRLEMYGHTSFVANEDQMRIGGARGSTGYLYMDPNAVLVIENGQDLVVGQYGHGTIETWGTITIDDDLKVGREDVGDHQSLGEITMHGTASIIAAGGSNAAIDFATGGGVAIITMNDDAYLSCGDDMRWTAGDNDGEVYIYMNDNAKIVVPDGEHIKSRDGYVYLEMNNNASIACDDMLLTYGGDNIEAQNYIYMNDPCTAIVIEGHLHFDEGYVYLEMNGGTITVSKDMEVARDNKSRAEIVMNGGTINVADDIDFANNGDIDLSEPNIPVVLLTMSNGASLTSGQVNSQAGHLMFIDDGYGELRMSGGSVIDVGNSHVIAISENDGSYVYVEMFDPCTAMICQDLEIGKNGGSVDFTIEGGTITIDDDLLVAHDVRDYDFPGTVNIVIDANSRIDIDNEFVVGGNGATVTITLKDGDIKMDDGDDSLVMPNSYSEDGSAVIVLGEDIAVKYPRSAKFEIDGYIDASYAGNNDYIDFLNGGLLDLEYDKITAEEIDAHIASGYFRTTFSQGDLNGEVRVTGVGPGFDEHYAVVYDVIGTERFEIHVGIEIIPRVCTPPVGDLDDDCIVDLNDLRIMAGLWLNDTSITI